MNEGTAHVVNDLKVCQYVHQVFCGTKTVFAIVLPTRTTDDELYVLAIMAVVEQRRSRQGDREHNQVCTPLVDSMAKS